MADNCGIPQYLVLERHINGDEIHVTYQQGYTAIGRPGWATHITTKYNGISYHYGYKRNNRCFFEHVDNRNIMPKEARSALDYWLNIWPGSHPALWAGSLNTLSGKGIKKSQKKYKNIKKSKKALKI